MMCNELDACDTLFFEVRHKKNIIFMRENMINIQRIDYVDTVKYICIMFVILSHLAANTNLMWAFYSPFFLSAFFFVSGYVYKQKGVISVILIIPTYIINRWFPFIIGRDYKKIKK